MASRIGDERTEVLVDIVVRCERSLDPSGEVESVEVRIAASGDLFEGPTVRLMLGGYTVKLTPKQVDAVATSLRSASLVAEAACP